MHRITLFAAVLLWTVVSYESVSAKGLVEQVREILQKRIAISAESHDVFSASESLRGSADLFRFYNLRDFSPAWVRDDGPRPGAMRLVRAIRNAQLEGLNPHDYQIATIEALLEENKRYLMTTDTIDVEELADLDLTLTEAFLQYASHLSAGRFNSEIIRSESLIKARQTDLTQILNSALLDGQIEKTLESLRPQDMGYDGLKSALIAYNDTMQAGGWPRVPKGPKIQIGDRGSRVAALRSRLYISGDLKETVKDDPEFFDEALDQAVLRFQHRHGLKEDGIVGRETLAALNVPAEDRVRQIKLNMERWRRLSPHDFGPRYLLVNIANFKLDVLENKSSIFDMRIVAGRECRPTPVFTGKMTYVVINPYWHIPQKLAVEDMLPRIKKDPEFVKEQNIRIFESWEAGARELDPESVDWSQITKENFSYKLRQDPGPLNALGRIKFMFPNRFGVYLHDTPSRNLFEKTKRCFSSGCVRVAEPVELAAYLLQDNPNWARERIMDAINSLKTQIVSLPEPIAVHIIYQTAWVDEVGTIQFRDDIYERDKILYEALNKKSPAHQVVSG
jgi:murein L,D-transpeptidase YcbB/YkuD